MDLATEAHAPGRFSPNTNISTNISWGGHLPSQMQHPQAAPTNLAFSKYGTGLHGALESKLQHDGMTPELLTRQGGGRQHAGNSSAATAAAQSAGKRRRNTGKQAKSTAAASPPSLSLVEEDDYLPAKSGGRGGAAAKEKEDPTMEHATRHQAAEQRRRNRIKEKLDKLKTRVPHVDPRTNTASFLEAVLRYIDVLQARVHELEAATSAPRSSSSVLPQPCISSPTQSEHQELDEEDRAHHHSRPNGRSSFETSTPAAAATMSECAYLLPPAQSPCLLPSSALTASTNSMLPSANVHLLGSSAQPLMLQSHNRSVQMQMLQQQQQQLQLSLQQRLGEMQMEQQAAMAMLGLQKASQQAAADAMEAGGHFSNIWPSNGRVFLLPADMNLQGYGTGGVSANKSPKILGGLNTLEALELLANQASSAGCYRMDAAQHLGGRRAAACMSVSEEDAAPRKRGRK